MTNEDSEMIYNLIDTLENENLPSVWKQISNLADIMKSEIIRINNHFELIENELSLLARDEAHPSAKIQIIEDRIEDLKREMLDFSTTLKNIHSSIEKTKNELNKKIDDLYTEVNRILDELEDIRTGQSVIEDFKDLKKHNIIIDIRKLNEAIAELTKRIEKIEQRRIRLTRRTIYKISRGDKQCKTTE